MSTLVVETVISRGPQASSIGTQNISPSKLETFFAWVLFGEGRATTYAMYTRETAPLRKQLNGSWVVVLFQALYAVVSLVGISFAVTFVVIESTPSYINLAPMSLAMLTVWIMLPIFTHAVQFLTLNVLSISRALKRTIWLDLAYLYGLATAFVCLLVRDDATDTFAASMFGILLVGPLLLVIYGDSTAFASHLSREERSVLMLQRKNLTEELYRKVAVTRNLKIWHAWRNKNLCAAIPLSALLVALNVALMFVDDGCAKALLGFALMVCVVVVLLCWVRFVSMVRIVRVRRAEETAKMVGVLESQHELEAESEGSEIGAAVLESMHRTKKLSQFGALGMGLVSGALIALMAVRKQSDS